MILRRVIAHFKKQEWTAIALDFVIVVVGVFIGIQASNWNAARSEAALERLLIESLQHDFQEILDGDRERYQRTIDAPDHLARLIDAIRSGEEPARDVVWPGLEAGVTGYATTPPSPTYDELRSTGRLSRLTNMALRRESAAFERSRLNEALLADYLAEISRGSPLFAHLDFDTANTGGLGLSGSYRWEGVAETLPYLQERLLTIQAQASWRRTSREHAREILTLIEEELK